MEILAPSHAGLLLEDRHANLFGSPWIDGRLVDHGRARFQMPADRDAGGLERSQVGLPRGVDRGGNGHDDKLGMLELGRILGNTQQLRPFQFRGRDLAGRVDPAPDILDFLARQVVTYGRVVLSELDRERKPDIAQADNGDRR